MIIHLIVSETYKKLASMVRRTERTECVLRVEIVIKVSSQPDLSYPPQRYPVLA